VVLKIFSPDFNNNIPKKNCVPLLYPLLEENISEEEKILKYGKWIEQIQIVNDVSLSNIVVPAFYINYYYSKKQVQILKNINQTAIGNSKITVCWTNGDWGVTPPLENFHLYRYGGYHSRNKGNEFCFPFFIGFDPVERFYQKILPIYKAKPKKAIIGFCGRASGNLMDSVIDIAKNIRRQIMHSLGLWFEDIDMFHSSSLRRYKMLQRITLNSNVTTNFICYRGFVGGLNSFKNAIKVNEIFYENMRTSHYVFCYRGWGNFSLRLYETLSVGRIPILVKSDNNLPFEEEINWNIFPVVKENEHNSIAEIVESFHNNLTESGFKDLQCTARNLWTQYFTYDSYMQKMVEKYLLIGR
jgi:hypothetical protein